MLFWSSDTELIKTVLTSRWWRQPSSTETEIRCSDAYAPMSMELGIGFILYLDLAIVTNTGIRPTLTRLFFQGQKSPFKKYEWRFSYMGNHKQLELFDLRAYTSEQPAVIDSEEEHFDDVRQCVQYEQLELDLFPQLSYKAHKTQVRLAA